MTGWGDMTYNSRRNILAAISVAQEISYHLFKIDTSATRAGQIARLYRKAQWHSQYSTLEGTTHSLCYLSLLFSYDFIARESDYQPRYTSQRRNHSDLRPLWDVPNF